MKFPEDLFLYIFLLSAPTVGTLSVPFVHVRSRMGTLDGYITHRWTDRAILLNTCIHLVLDGG